LSLSVSSLSHRSIGISLTAFPFRCGGWIFAVFMSAR
jgi:hypothetical protein